MRVLLVAAVFFGVSASSSVAGEAKDKKAVNPMAPFEELAGRVWRGEGTGPNGQPLVDIAVHEMIMGGKAFQSTHKLEGGTYGGRTIFFYDPGAKEYVFHYFTTAGFHTTGTMEPTETGFDVVEKVNGHPKYAEVRSEMVVNDDELRVVTRHVTHEGEVSAGDTLNYRELSQDEYILFFDEADALFRKRKDVKGNDKRYANIEVSYLLASLSQALFTTTDSDAEEKKQND